MKQVTRIIVYTASGKEEYNGDSARELSNALDYAATRGASWTTPIETFPGEYVEYNFKAIERIVTIEREVPTIDDEDDKDDMENDDTQP